MARSTRSSTRPALVLGLVLGLVASVGGCVGVSGELSPPSDASGTSAESTSAEPSGDPIASGDPISTTNPALDFAAVDLDGNPITGVDGPVALWFWAPWCVICRGESPVLAGAVVDNPDVTFIGIASLDELPAIQAFPAETGTDGFRHVADLDGEIWAAFGVTAQPAMAFIAADGTVKVITGAMAPQDLQAKIDTYLG